MSKALERVIVLGNTPAAWVSSVFLRKRLGIEVVLVCPPADPNRFKVNQAETFTPDLLKLHQMSGLQEQHWFLPSSACFQTATRVLGRSRNGNEIDAMLAYSSTGASFNGMEFHHYFLGAGLENFESYSLGACMARANKFVHPVADPRSIFSSFDYGMAIDVAKYISLMVKYAQHLGVKVMHVERLDLAMCGSKIKHIQLADGSSCSADLFIDATDEQSTQQTMHDVDCTTVNECQETLFASVSQRTAAQAYKTIIASELGTLESNALPNAMCYRLSYNRDEMSQQEAHAGLAERLGIKPEQLSSTVKANKAIQLNSHWFANCIGIGEGVGNPAPAYFGSIELAIRSINTLIDIIPVDDDLSINCLEYNRLLEQSIQRSLEYQHAFNYLLHAPSKKFPLQQEQPAALMLNELFLNKLHLFKSRGHLIRYDNDPIANCVWINLCMLCDYKPDTHHPLLKTSAYNASLADIEKIKSLIALSIKKIPNLGEYRQKLSARPS
jgi:tryptophan halogenase